MKASICIYALKIDTVTLLRDHKGLVNDKLGAKKLGEKNARELFCFYHFRHNTAQKHGSS